MPSYDALDTLLEHYSKEKNITKPQAFHTNSAAVDRFMKIVDSAKSVPSV